MEYFRKILLFSLFFCLFSCGKNDQNKELTTVRTSKQEVEKKTTIKSESNLNDSIYLTANDSIKAVKESVLRKQNYKKTKEIVTTDEIGKEASNPILTSDKPEPKKIIIPSHVYIKKILNQCKIGVPMSQKDLQTNFDIPEEAIQLVKSLTKISPNELDIKWKSTWLIEKISDAKFKDGRLKVKFDKNKMYTSGDAIGIKYEKKMYTDLVLIGRSAYIPSVKGFYWQIGKD